MTVFTFGVLVLLVAALMVDRFRSESAHRSERERLVRAVMAKTIPEFVALQKVIEGEVTPPRRLRAVGEDRDPDVPMLPEGM